MIRHLDIYQDGATGDMYQRSASGLLIPIPGKVTAAVPTVQPDGSIAFVVPTGGGGGGTGDTFAYWDPDKPPAVAHAADDEAEGLVGTTPPGWTAFNLATSSTFLYDGKGRIDAFVPGGSGDVLRFWYKTVTGSYTLTTKMAALMAGSFNSSGLAMRDPTSGKMLSLGMQHRGSTVNWIFTWWTNSTTWAGETIGPAIDMNDDMYFQLTWNGSTVTARYARNGVDFQVWTTSTWFSGGAPTQVGVQGNSQSGGDNHGYFNFFRVKAATSDQIGGIRTVGSGGGGSASLNVYDEGSSVGTGITGLNFIGAAVVAGAPVSGVVPVTISGGTIDVKDEGTTVATGISALNFIGANVVAGAAVAGVVPITVTGSSGGGGGGTANSNWDTTAFPVDPAIDLTRSIDFATATSLSGWTWVNQGSSTAALQRKRLFLSTPANGGSGTTTRRLFFAPTANQLPASPWCLQVPITLYPGTNYNMVGIWIKGADANKGLLYAIHLRHDQGNAIHYIMERMNSVTSVGTDVSIEAGQMASVLSIGYDGTNFTFSASPDGRDWRADAAVTESAATFLGAGPYTYALFVDSVGPRAVGGAFNNVVLLNQITPIPHGQLVTASGSGSGSVDDTNLPWPWADLPASPSALDDSFPGTSLDAKWSIIGGAGLTNTVKNGWLVMEATATGAAFNARGIEQILPSGNFSVFTIVRQLGFGQYSIGGLHVRNATSGAMLRATCFNNSSSIADVWWGAARYSSLTARSAVMGEGSTPAGSIREFIQRISYDGTNIVVSVSRDGWNFYTITSEAIGTTFGAGAPNRVGLAIDPFSATLPGRVGYRTFKYVAVANAGIGAFQ